MSDHAISHPESVPGRLFAVKVEAERLLKAIPSESLPTSERRREHNELRKTREQGGPGQARALDELNIDAQLMVAAVLVYMEGAIHGMRVQRNGGVQVSNAALTVVLRSAVEGAALIQWLLEPGIGAAQRARRHIMWRFGDLAENKRVVATFQNPQEPDLAASIKKSEAEIVGLADACRFEMIDTGKGPSLRKEVSPSPHGSTPKAPKPDQMPRLTELIRTSTRKNSLYSLLSATTHPSRFSTIAAVQRTRTTGLLAEGFGVPWSTALSIAGWATASPLVSLATWNGVKFVTLAERIRVFWSAADLQP